MKRGKAKSMFERVRTAVRAVKRTGLSAGQFFLHGVSYEDAVDLWANGFKPEKKVMSGRIYFVLTSDVDGVIASVFTDNRDPVPFEREDHAWFCAGQWS